MLFIPRENNQLTPMAMRQVMRESTMPMARILPTRKSVFSPARSGGTRVRSAITRNTWNRPLISPAADIGAWNMMAAITSPPGHMPREFSTNPTPRSHPVALCTETAKTSMTTPTMYGASDRPIVSRRAMTRRFFRGARTITAPRARSRRWRPTPEPPRPPRRRARS